MIFFYWEIFKKYGVKFIYLILSKYYQKVSLLLCNYYNMYYTASN